MKRFLVFAGDNYYPRGGFKDLKAQGDTYIKAWDNAKVVYQKTEFDWCHIVDTEDGCIFEIDYRVFI